jgi:hypothetical protein
MQMGKRAFFTPAVGLAREEDIIPTLTEAFPKYASLPE